MPPQIRGGVQPRWFSPDGLAQVASSAGNVKSKTASKQEKISQPQPRQGRPQAPRQTQPTPLKASSSQTLVQALRRATPPPIIPQPEVSYDEVSVCYFIRRFVTPDDNDNLPGHLTFLPSLYNKQDSHGLLELATLSVAQMAAYNHFGGDRFRLQSYQNYGRALGALRKSIQSEDEVTDDRVLAAVLLLTMFKDIGEEGWGDPSEHAPGLYYLLQKRGVEQFCTSRGFELFLLALLKLRSRPHDARHVPDDEDHVATTRPLEVQHKRKYQPKRAPRRELAKARESRALI
ncbi:hypothetical protein O1611_g9386 [Lasiodiplodia mahajangana]|uniref:Uncharacterized protein n=1 Tax=Lasiodiplodia mahajangana TaxID=1108764 RepID=A0ACC2JA49_9PEZI|nr:hypothetical protein O1611_g9386 [Lasiodiplodia mahajangana]